MSLHSNKMARVLALERGHAEQLTVRMRIALDGLDGLWQQRIRERCFLPSPLLQKLMQTCKILSLKVLVSRNSQHGLTR